MRAACLSNLAGHPACAVVSLSRAAATGASPVGRACTRPRGSIGGANRPRDDFSDTGAALAKPRHAGREQRDAIPRALIQGGLIARPYCSFGQSKIIFSWVDSDGAKTL
jgi:hypothetical protein